MSIITLNSNCNCNMSWLFNKFFDYKLKKKQMIYIEDLYIDVRLLSDAMVSPRYVLNVIFERFVYFLECEFYILLEVNDNENRIKNILTNKRFIENCSYEFKDKYNYKDLKCDVCFSNPNTIFQRIIDNRDFIISNDLILDEKINANFPAGHAHINNIIGFPIIVNNKIINIIGFANKDGDFNRKDILFLKRATKKLYHIISEL